jgi:hypothetical protein
MVWGSNWSADRVADGLVAVFRALPGTPIYSPRLGVFKPLHPIQGLELITAVQLCLGRESPAARLLLAWARMRAAGESFQAHCREIGRARSTCYHQRNSSLKRVAAWLNRERGSAAAATIDAPSA